MPLDQVDVDALTEEKEMSFLDHVEELRWHIIRSCVSVLVFTIAAFAASTPIFKHIIFAPRDPDFLFYRTVCWLSNAVGLGDRLCLVPKDFDLQGLQMGEAFITSIKVALMIGIATSVPYIFWEIWRFIKPGLLDSEKRAARGFVFVCSILFFSGVLFGYYIISPFTINFLVGYEVEGVVSNPSFASYINYMIMFTLPTGLVFQLPVVVYFLSKIGIVTPEFMRKYRRHAFILILLLAAIITPPDVITQLLIGFPLYILYEASIFISKRVHKKNVAQEKTKRLSK